MHCPPAPPKGFEAGIRKNKMEELSESEIYLFHQLYFPNFYLLLALVSSFLQAHKTMNIISSTISIIIKLSSHEMICQIHEFVTIKIYLPSPEPLLFSQTFIPNDSKANVFGDLQLFLSCSKAF